MNLQNKTLRELSIMKAVFETSDAPDNTRDEALRKVNKQIAQLNGQRKDDLIREINESLAEMDIDAF